LLPNLRSKSQCKIANEDSALAALLESLKKLEFLPTVDNELACARNFYDPSIDVFRAMHTQSELVPKPFTGTKWTSFLRECGVHYEVSQTNFIDYAMQIADAGRGERS
jgi:hypothetical protein